MSKSKVHEFHPQIYPRRLWVIKGGLFGDIKDMFSQRDGKELDLWDEDYDYDALTYSVMLKETKKFGELIWFPDETSIEQEKVTHESAHAAMDIFIDIDADVDTDNQEPFAYLAGWIADCIDQVNVINSSKNEKIKLKRITNMEKINVAELLKDCPKGMELDCAIWDNCTFEGIEDVGYINILVKTPNGLVKLSKEGYLYHNHSGSKCVIFPKGKTTWEGFVPPCKFKDGDVVYIKTKGYNHNEFIIIFNEIKNNHIHKHACFAYQVLYTCKNAVCHLVDVEIMRLATEEEKAKLFQKIKDNGYKWNPESKTLEKLIVPKFKVGDRIRHKNDKTIIKTICYVYHNSYALYDGHLLLFTDQDMWELAPNKFDINTLKPFESRVLVRNKNHYKWEGAVFGRYDGNTFFTIGGNDWRYCIPYEGNEHLLGKTDDCDEHFKIWKK